MKRILVISALAAVCILAIVSYFFYGQEAEAELTNGNTNATQQEDFILHIRVESMEEGFQVSRALQYVGEGSVEVEHQTPLVSVSFKNQNHDYTGSTMTKTLNTGNSYHPQGPKTFEAPRSGTYILFCEARFMVNDKFITINHQEELEFN
ncbi:hypothetical protein [Lentibacillus amyloliquefaciens]|uniref:Uncharacterized protein n=1 Tax=Lentibacillus amyloliquefaciens TaxID=1472767 RepID=A0A0U3NKJ9_9BACI|nr:hypothetical protein [Lentibacillus amyloliquefaciens]ALX47307.1 hypothetical protein AOX59_01055 [Lentibacillus amyloliquefaciens]